MENYNNYNWLQTVAYTCSFSNLMGNLKHHTTSNAHRSYCMSIRAELNQQGLVNEAWKVQSNACVASLPFDMYPVIHLQKRTVLTLMYSRCSINIIYNSFYLKTCIFSMRMSWCFLNEHQSFCSNQVNPCISLQGFLLYPLISSHLWLTRPSAWSREIKPSARSRSDLSTWLKFRFLQEECPLMNHRNPKDVTKAIQNSYDHRRQKDLEQNIRWWKDPHETNTFRDQRL